MNRFCKTAATAAKWVLGLWAIVLTAVLVMQTVNVYQTGLSTGEQMYTREIVAENALRLAVPLIGFTFLALVLYIAGLFSPERCSIAAMTPAQRVELAERYTAPCQAIDNAKKYRRIVRTVQGLLLLLCLLALLMICLSPDRFVSMDLEYVMAEAMPLILIPVAAAFAVSVCASCLIEKSCVRELEEIKNMPKAKSAGTKAASAASKNSARTVIAIASLVLITLGILNGGMYDVLVKAINICTECIGLG